MTLEFREISHIWKPITTALIRFVKQQESPAVADKPTRRESIPKIAPVRRAYKVVADIRLAVVASEICEIRRNPLKIQTYKVQGHPRSSILVSIESAYATSY